MTAARGAASAAAVRMFYRVHGDAAVMRLAAEPAIATGLADRNIHVIRVRHRADGAGAAAVNEALLARVQANNHVVMVAAAQRAVGAGGTRELTALADLQFHIVDDGAERGVAERRPVARRHGDIVAGVDAVADRETLWGEDV